MTVRCCDSLYNHIFFLGQPIRLSQLVKARSAKAKDIPDSVG
jgi:hypothetical protein